jgi:hypothetical protein
LLAVSRNLGPTRLEHSFALTLCVRLESKARHFLDHAGSPGQMGPRGRTRLQSARRLAAALSTYRRFAAEHGITELRSSPRPNNVLLHERRYRRVWVAARWLADEDARRQALGAGANRTWQELVALVTAGALGALDLLALDTGFAVHEPESPAEPPSGLWPGLWFRSTSDRFQKLRLGLPPGGDIAVWLLETNGEVTTTKRFLIATAKRAGSDWSLLRDVAFRDQWAGLHVERDLLVEALSEWSGLPAATHPAPPLHAGTSSTGFLRVAATELRFHWNGSFSRTAACAVGIRVDSIAGDSSGPPLFLTGDSATHLRIFRGHREPDFPGEVPLSTGVAGSWIVPGWFFRSCSTNRLLLGEARRALLLSVTGAAPLRRLVAARPHRLSYAAQSRFYEALPSPVERKLMVPQPVAAALAWMEDNPGGAVEQAWLGFLDLDGEFPDFALLQCKRFDASLARLGWLRYPPFGRNQPPDARWANQVAADALTRAGIPITGATGGAVLAQLPESALLELALDQRDTASAWVRHEHKWRRLAIHQQHVQRVLEHWAAQVKAHVQNELLGRASFTPKRIVVSGMVSAAAAVQNAFRDLPVPADFTGEDTVARGLAVFERWLRAGLPTYRDFVPDLKIMVSGQAGASYWHSLFTGAVAGLEASVDQPLLGEEFEFDLAAHKTTFPLPMMSGNERAEENPIIRLASPPAANCKVLVHARYEAAGRGLVLSLRSKDPGLLPPTELEWGNLQAETITEEPPPLPPHPKLANTNGELAQFLDDLKTVLSHLGTAPHEQLRRELKHVLNGLSRFLQNHVVSSAAEEWISLPKVSRAPLSDLLVRLAFFIDVRERDLASPVFPEGCPGFKRPAGRAALEAITDDNDLQYHLNICLRRFAAAAPDGFLRHCLTQLKNQKTRKNIRQACIYSLGRCASVWTQKGARQDAVAMIFRQIEELSSGASLTTTEEWELFGWWSRSLVLFLAGNPWHIADIPIQPLHQVAQALRDAIGKLTAAECDDENAWRSALASLLYLRYAMHIQGEGPKIFGPKSPLARSLIHALRQAAHSRVTRNTAKVSLKRFLQNPEIIQGDTAFEQVANVWEGKAADALLRATAEDE